MSRSAAATSAARAVQGQHLEELRIEPLLVEGSLGPLPLEWVRSALGRQAELPAPAKLVLWASGEAGILVEVPRDPDPERSATQLQEAIEVARAWLDGVPEPPRPVAETAGVSERVEGALSRLPWSWEPQEAGTYRVHVSGRDIACRLDVRSARGRLHVSTAPMLLELDGSRAREAAQIFALEANRRFRLARLTVSEARDGIASVLWDAFLPPGLDAEPGLIDAVEAVVGARAASLRGLRALAVASVAETYLALRCANPAARVSGNLPVRGTGSAQGREA